MKNKAGDDFTYETLDFSQMVAKTYHQTLRTHLLEAYFQREVYRLVDAGKSLDADTLKMIYLKKLLLNSGDQKWFLQKAQS